MADTVMTVMHCTMVIVCLVMAMMHCTLVIMHLVMAVFSADK